MTLILFLFACGRVAAIEDRVLDPDKVIHDYEWFHSAHARVHSREAQIRDTRAQMADADPAERSRLRIDLSGQQQSCRDLVADYNANADKITRGIFRGWSLPENIDPETCE